ELITGDPLGGQSEKVSRHRSWGAEIRSGDLVLNRQAGRVHASGGNAVVRKWIGDHRTGRAEAPRRRVEDAGAQRREIAGAKAQRRYVVDLRAGPGRSARALIVDKEERPVPPVVDPGSIERAAQREAELVLAIERFRQTGGVREKVGGVEGIVSQELEERPV